MMKASSDSIQEIEDTRRATLNMLSDLEEERRALAIVVAKNEALLESLGDGILAADKDGVITNINQAAEKLLRGSQDDFLGKKLNEVLHIWDDKGERISNENRPFQKAFVTGKKVVETFIYERRDRTKFPAAVTMTPVIYDSKIVGAIEVFRDVTKELELDRAKDEFISLASHQLKGPITAISWSLGEFLIQNKSKLSKEQKDLLEKVFEINKGMSELVGGFLDVTRMETSGFAVETGEVDLKETCDLVIEELKGQIEERKIEIIKKYDKEDLISNIGLKAARILFQNLLTNAIKYSSEKRRVEISIEKHDKGILVSIKDSGVGIPEKSKGFIFTKLFRADNAKTQEPNGTGLGLYLVKSLLDKSGGKIWFESTEGKGTTFFVELKK